MNILYLMKYWPTFGGGETVTRILANEFVKRGHKVSVAFLISRTDGIESFVDSRVVCLQLPKETPNDPINVTVLKNIIEEKQIAIVINQWDALFLELYSKLKTENLKFINCLHTAVWTKNPNKNFKYYANAWAKPIFMCLKKWKTAKRLWRSYIHCDAYVMLSPSFVDDTKHLLENKDLDHLYSIANPILFAPVSVSLKKEKILLFVGRIADCKRIPYILEVWSSICTDKKYNDWKLVIVGDGPDLEKSKKQVESLERVFFEGYQNPKSYYERAPISLMTSAFEGFPMTLVEAQQRACVPVVMDSFSALHDIVENKKNGLIVPNNDLVEYTQAVCLLMDNEGMRMNLAKNGLESCKKFDIEKIANQWDDLFEKLVGRDCA